MRERELESQNEKSTHQKTYSSTMGSRSKEDVNFIVCDQGTMIDRGTGNLRTRMQTSENFSVLCAWRYRPVRFYFLILPKCQKLHD